MDKKFPNPTDKHVGNRVRMRQRMFITSHAEKSVVIKARAAGAKSYLLSFGNGLSKRPIKVFSIRKLREWIRQTFDAYNTSIFFRLPRSGQSRELIKAS